jgi:acetoin utilization protein AcuC
VLQNGCDAHLLDPLTHLRCSTRIYEETVRLVGDLADEYCGGRVVATGGGGYAVWRVVPRAWTLVWASLTGQVAPDAVPRAWLQRWQGESPVLLPEGLRDDPALHPAAPQCDEVAATNRRMLESLRRTAMPILRGWSLGF